MVLILTPPLCFNLLKMSTSYSYITNHLSLHCNNDNTCVLMSMEIHTDHSIGIWYMSGWKATYMFTLFNWKITISCLYKCANRQLGKECIPLWAKLLMPHIDICQEKSHRLLFYITKYKTQNSISTCLCILLNHYNIESYLHLNKKKIICKWVNYKVKYKYSIHKWPLFRVIINTQRNNYDPLAFPITISTLLIYIKYPLPLPQNSCIIQNIIHAVFSCTSFWVIP